MITAVIVEDEKSSKEYLFSILEKHHPDIKILSWATDVVEAVMTIRRAQPDIVFLDVQLNGGNGFEVLDAFNANMSFEVIFTTGLLDYKERAMDYFAFYYLNKPIQAEELRRVLKMYRFKRSAFDLKKYNAFKSQIESKNEILNIAVNDEYYSIKHQKIMYCAADGNYTAIHTVDGKEYLMSKNLKRVAEVIENDTFFRVHRSTLVNMKYIESIGKENFLTLTDGTKLAISIRSRKKVIENFNKYKQLY